MKKQDLTRFVGLPYKFLGTDFTGVDCIGLCQLFFNEHGYPIEIREITYNKLRKFNSKR